MNVRHARASALAVVVAALLAAGLSTPSIADEKGDVKKQQSEVSKQLGDAQADAEESSAALVAAVKKLKEANDKLAAAKANLQATQGQLALAQAEDTRIAGELNDAQTKLSQVTAAVDTATRNYKTSKAAVEQFIVDNSMQGSVGLRAFGDLVSGNSTVKFSEQLAANDTISDAQTSKVQQLEADRVMLQLQQESATTLRDQVAEAKKKSAANVVTMQTLTTQAQQQEQSVESLVSEQASVQSAAKQAADEDAEQVKQLEAEKSQLQAKYAALAQAELAAAASGGDANSSSGGDGGGTLSYPVNAPITSPYGMRFHPILHVWKLHDGTDFGVACGTPVKAAASGTVTEEFFNAAYGNRLFLNNGIKRGVGIVTIYNHLTSFKVPVGTHVKRGDVIALSGTTGWSTGCHLHFMVLVNGETVNPMGWL